jgi:hypothetical protein
MSEKKISAAATVALAAWSTYLEDGESFEELAEAMAKLHATVRGQPYRPNRALEAMRQAGNVTIDQLPKHDAPFASRLSEAGANDAS